METRDASKKKPVISVRGGDGGRGGGGGGSCCTPSAIPLSSVHDPCGTELARVATARSVVHTWTVKRPTTADTQGLVDGGDPAFGRIPRGLWQHPAPPVHEG